MHHGSNQFLIPDGYYMDDLPWDPDHLYLRSWFTGDAYRVRIDDPAKTLIWVCTAATWRRFRRPPMRAVC